MFNLLEIEKTHRSRIRKLALSFGAIGGGYFVQYTSGEPITWPLMALVAVVALAFTSADTLDKALQSGALGKLKDKFIPSDK